MGRAGIVDNPIGDAGGHWRVCRAGRRCLSELSARACAWGVRNAGGRVALTFDDCGDPAAWRSILSTLRGRNVRAAFFCIGQQVEAHPTLARRVRSDGEMLCNHSWSHPDLATLGARAIAQQIRRARATIRAVTGSRCGYFRPPYGSYSRAVLEIAGQLGYRHAALWSVDPQDWQRPGVRVIQRRVLAATRSGSIVLLHCLPQTAQALPGIISGLHRRHLTPVLLRTLVHIGNPGPGWWPRYSSLLTAQPTAMRAFPPARSVDARIPMPPLRPIVAA